MDPDAESSLLLEPLTSQETTILELLADGLSNRDIADRLFLSQSTVKWYVRQLNSKLATRNREEIIERAYAIGLLQKDEPDDSVLGAHNLPGQTTPFIGRQQELHEVNALFDDDDLRLLTILAPGGMGKTSFALEVAGRQLGRYSDGIYFVDLAPLGSFDEQLLTSLYQLIDMLRAGHSVLHCFELVAVRAPEPISGAFRRVLADVNAGMELSQALENLQQLVGSTHFGRVVAVIQAQQQQGGSLNERLDMLDHGLKVDLGEIVWRDKTQQTEDMIVTAIAGAIGYQLKSGQRSYKQQLLDFLARKQMLLLLDNFEHLLDGASLLVEMLQAAPQVRLLITSRERLNLSGETVYTLYGLDIPQWQTLDNALDYDAVKVLVQAARHVHPEFAVTEANLMPVMRICQLTQGMPLGLLLAAAWLDVLTLEEIAAEIKQSADFLETEMRDIPVRQRSIRAVFDTAWQRLDHAEREVFMRLSVFRGSFSRQAAETIAGATLRILQKLVSKSLIVQSGAGGGRYLLHELLRQYAAAQLKQSGNAADIQQAHCEYYLAMLRNREADLKGQDQFLALEAIEEESQNIRAAWRCAISHRDVERIDQAIEGLNLFAYMRGNLHLHQKLILLAWRQFAPLPGETPSLAWGRIQARRWGQIQYAPPHDAEALQSAFEQLQQCLEIAEQHDNDHEAAYCLLLLGYLHMFRQDYEAMLATLLDSNQRFTALGDTFYSGWSLHQIGYAYRLLGDFENAIEYTQQGLALANRIGDHVSAINCLFNLGSFYATEQGDYEKGDRYLTEAYQLARQMRAHWQASHCANLAAIAAFCNGDIAKAREIARRERPLVLRSGYELDVPYNASICALLDCMDRNFSSASELIDDAWNYRTAPIGYFYLHWATVVSSSGLGEYERMYQHLPRMVELSANRIGLLMLALPEVAYLNWVEGHSEHAAQIVGLVLSHPAAATRWLVQCPLMGDFCDDLQTELGEERYAQALDYGKSMSVDEILHAFQQLIQGKNGRLDTTA
jgi:predicted ATPase/DNA-binding CsgD family transcriptional regulator